MAKPCDICGDPGVIEAIITCCQCKVAREHLYCMRALKMQAPPFWLCEECDESKLVSPITTVEEQTTTDKEQKTQKVSTLMQRTNLVVEGSKKSHIASHHKFKEKRVDKGKAKYLSCDEAVKLSSGKVVLHFQNRGNAIATQPVKSSVSSRRDEITTPEREMKRIKNELPSSKKDADTSRDIEVPKLLKKLEKAETKSDCKDSADMEAVRFAAGKLDLTCSLPVSEMHDPYVPSLSSYWRGCFYLPDGLQRFNDAFKAHPPSRIHHKVYETVKKMPEKICFELVPNHELRLEIFPADRDDIALYFFPIFKRSEDDLCVTDFIWRQNLVMRSYVDGVELLVLSSRVLPSHSQEYQGNYFLWGVFRCSKTIKTVADKQSLMEVDRKPFDDVPPGFKKIHNDVPCDDVPPGFKKIHDDAPPGFKKICKP